MVTRPTKPIHPYIAFAAALIAGLVAASPASATFAAPFDLSASGQNASSARVAVDADGDAVFTWVRFDGANDRVQARARSAAGVLSPVQTLSSSGRNASSPQVAVDAGGDAVFTWLRSDGANDRVQARARSAGGLLTSVQTLSDPGQNAVGPQVAIDADGDAVFTWVRSDGANDQIQARARSAAGVVSAVQTLSDVSVGFADNPKVAVDADGDAVFAWRRNDFVNSRIQTRARSAAGVLSPIQFLSRAGQAALDQDLAIDADGDAVFAWQRFDSAGDLRIQARARSAAGTLSAVQDLSAAGEDANQPAVAVEADGDALFTWRRFDGANERIQTRSRSAGGTLSAVQDLSGAGAGAFNPDLAIDADGDAVFGWRRGDGFGFVIQARERTATGALFAVQTISEPGVPNDSESGPQVGVGADGDALVTWQRSAGANLRIEGAAGP